MRVAVVGLGKLGCPLAAWLATRHEVVGIDISPIAVDMVNKNIAPLEPGVDELMGGFAASTDYAAADDAEIAFVIVPTPSGADGAFSLEYVQAAVHGLRPHFHGTLVVTSTVMPGHTESLRWDGPLLYNPWFVALGNVLHDFQHPPFVLIGQRDDADGRRLSTFWREMGVAAKVRRMDFRSAEVAKLSLNCYIVTKIAFANYLAALCDELGADGRAVTEAISLDPRIGSKYFSPGTPPQGPCFPRDSRALARASRVAGVEPRIPVAVDLENAVQLHRLVHEAIETDAKTVAVLGLAYKPGTHVTEESVGLRIAKALKQSGRTVLQHDPMVAPGDAQAIVNVAEAVVIATAWDEYRALDYSDKKVIDPWNITTH